MQQEVNIAMFNQERTPFVYQDRWIFAAKHKYGWVRKLQILAFEWLVKRGAMTSAIGETLTYKSVRLSDKNPTVNSISRLVAHMASHGQRPKHLYLGPDMAEKMMHGIGDSAMHVMSFTHGRPREIMGIPWTVVPWMEGWVIVPEDRR